MSRPSRAVVLFCLLAMCCATSAGADEVVSDTREVMGTYFTVSVWTGDEARARAAIDAVFRRVAEIDRRFSTYKPDSEISRVNALAGKEGVPVTPEFAKILRAGLEAGRLSGGAFDVSFAGLKVWDFGAPDPRVPTDEEIAAQLPLVDYRNVVLDEKAGTVRFAGDGMQIGMGGIVQGYSSDEAAAILERAGFHDYIVNSSGDILISGDKDGTPWRVGVQNPRGPHGDLIAIVSGARGAVVTSGDYERFFEKDGVRYHHIVDPRTGRPSTGAMSVTIVTERAIDADWMATAVMVLGPKDGLALVEKTPGVQCLIVAADGTRATSSGLEKAVAIEYVER